MGDRKEEDLYRNFSRKDLQGLCKKYGLPANKSNPEMATSLILYLEKKNLTTRAIWEGTRSDLFASGTTELQNFVRMNSTDDQRKDCRRMASHSGSGNNHRPNHQDAQSNEFQNCKASTTSDKASVNVGNLTQPHSESFSGAGVPENTFSVVSSVVAPVPTFTFDVRREDGIQLFVDLNSSPSDWIESLKSGVQINNVVHKPKSQSFHEDIGLLCCPKQKNDSSSLDPSKETDNGQGRSYPTTILTDNLAQTDKPDEGEGSLPSPGLKSLSNAAHSLVTLKGGQGCSASRLESGYEGQLSSAKFAADSDLNAAVRTRMCCNIAGNFMPSDPKCSGMPAHQDASAGDGSCKKLPLQQTSSSLGPTLKCNESTTVFMEMQASTCATMNRDVGYSPSGIGRSLDVVDQQKNDKVVQSGIVESYLTPRDGLQMWSAQAVDQRTRLSPGLKCLQQGLADNRSKVETDRSRTTFYRKPGRKIREAPSHSAGSHSKSRYNSPSHKFVSQDVNLTNGIEMENDRFLRTQLAGSETDGLQEKEAAFYPRCNDGSLEMTIPKKIGLDHSISTKSNQLQEDICRSPSTTFLENLGKSDSGDGRVGSECLSLKSVMEKPCKKPSEPETTEEQQRKGNFDSVEHQSKFVNTEAKNLRSTKQFAGEGHSKRRRSSRLFTK